MCTPFALLAAGTGMAVAGNVAQGIAGRNAAKEQIAGLDAQAATERQLTTVTDQRRRAEFRSQIAQQRAELAARGVSLDSVTAIALGQQAAKEMSFDSQATIATGVAKQKELSSQARYAATQARASALQGVTSAAGSVLSSAPDLWPELYVK